MNPGFFGCLPGASREGHAVHLRIGGYACDAGAAEGVVAMKAIAGLHHVTAIVGDAQRTVDFYTQVLGLRFVKRTVNFDDPGSYHLYFGDDAGAPGTILTFFAWPGASRGSAGVGETLAIAFSVPVGAVAFWERRLRDAGVEFEAGSRFGERVLGFADPDGIRLEIVGHDEAEAGEPARDASVPAEYAVRGFFGVTLAEAGLVETEKMLGAMGFDRVGEEGAWYRFAAAGDGLASRVDVLVAPQMSRPRTGAGTIHHIAFRNADDAAQLEWRTRLEGMGLDVTPVMDRTYFHSVYFREPGGVLFELATDPPGFALDEPRASLGEALKLPEWLESKRGLIEKRLPLLELHKGAAR
jgi:glyoxalase family protein